MPQTKVLSYRIEFQAVVTCKTCYYVSPYRPDQNKIKMHKSSIELPLPPKISHYADCPLATIPNMEDKSKVSTRKALPWQSASPRDIWEVFIKTYVICKDCGSKSIANAYLSLGPKSPEFIFSIPIPPAVQHFKGCRANIPQMYCAYCGTQTPQGCQSTSREFIDVATLKLTYIDVCSECLYPWHTTTSFMGKERSKSI